MVILSTGVTSGAEIRSPHTGETEAMLVIVAGRAQATTKIARG
jgi:hypothetical protein